MSDFMSQVGSVVGHPSIGSGGTAMTPSTSTGSNIWQGTTPQGTGQPSNPFSLTFAPAQPAQPRPLQPGQNAAGGILNSPLVQNGGSMLLSSLMGLL